MPVVILPALASDDDSAGVELTQYPRGAGRGLGLQMLVGDGHAYTYLTPAGAVRLGALLCAWGHDTLLAQRT